VEGFTTIGTWNLKKSHHHSGPSPMRPDELWTEPPGHKPLVVNVIVVGPFEEEEEGTGVACDIVKVQGEDPDTPGYPKGDRVKLGRRRSRTWVRLPWLVHDEAP